MSSEEKRVIWAVASVPGLALGCAPLADRWDSLGRASAAWLRRLSESVVDDFDFEALDSAGPLAGDAVREIVVAARAKPIDRDEAHRNIVRAMLHVPAQAIRCHLRLAQSDADALRRRRTVHLLTSWL